MSLHRPAPRPAVDAGLTLVEVMVAMVLFVLGSLSLLSVLTSSMSGTSDNRARLTAANLAASDVDEARVADYYALSPADYTRTVDGREYQVVREVTVTMASGASTSACVGSGSAKQVYKKVSTRVTTAFRSATTKAVRADTLVRAPLFDPNSALGAIGFTVLDRASAPLAGLTVSVSSTNRTTDSRGCSFFDGLPPGDYTVTVTRPGSVTRAGSSTLSKTVKVAAGQITADSLRVDTAVPLGVGVGAFQGSTQWPGYSAPTGSIATIAASDRSNVTRIAYPSKSLTAGVDTTWSVFPAPGGYDAWLGSCSSLVAHADSEPGTTPRTVLQLSPVTVRLHAQNTGDQNKTQNRGVSLTWSPTSACSETLNYGVVTDSTCSPTSNGTGQCLLLIAVPPGTWTFKINGLSYSTTATVDPRTASTVSINAT